MLAASRGRLAANEAADEPQEPSRTYVQPVLRQGAGTELLITIGCGCPRDGGREIACEESDMTTCPGRKRRRTVPARRRLAEGYCFTPAVFGSSFA